MKRTCRILWLVDSCSATICWTRDWHSVYIEWTTKISKSLSHHMSTSKWEGWMTALVGHFLTFILTVIRDITGFLWYHRLPLISLASFDIIGFLWYYRKRLASHLGGNIGFTLTQWRWEMFRALEWPDSRPFCQHQDGSRRLPAVKATSLIPRESVSTYISSKV